MIPGWQKCLTALRPEQISSAVGNHRFTSWLVKPSSYKNCPKFSHRLRNGNNAVQLFIRVTIRRESIKVSVKNEHFWLYNGWKFTCCKETKKRRRQCFIWLRRLLRTFSLSWFPIGQRNNLLKYSAYLHDYTISFFASKAKNYFWPRMPRALAISKYLAWFSSER